MATVDIYADLIRLGRPVITNAEAAARMRCSPRTAGKRLRTMEKAGLIQRAKQGVWLLDSTLPTPALAPYLTAPRPAYVSMISALALHGVIEQIPRQVSVVSLDRTRTVDTSLARFRIHHIHPDLFGGFEGTPGSGYIALPGKALFDAIYIQAAAGSTAHFPELNFPDPLGPADLAVWVDRIGSSRLQTIVSRRLISVLGS